MTFKDEKRTKTYTVFNGEKLVVYKTVDEYNAAIKEATTRAAEIAAQKAAK
jgi:uncharacterized protein YlzI (FlbEa/FlbD family)